MTSDHKLITPDIKDLHINIPIQETINIKNKLLKQENINTKPTNK
jgi:hypothetical protein